jgi:3-hydroxyisobutyrate dehydrogenase
VSRSVDAVVVGLGAMGLPMARNLAAAGLEVVGVEPSASRRADAADLPTVAALGDAPRSTCVLAMVATAEQLTTVVDDALAAGPSEATWILSGTLGVDAVLAQAERLRTISARVVDAPVTGGVAGATAGTLMLFVGGAEPDIAAAQPVLRALGTAEVVGDRVGDGQMMKMVNQHLCSIHLAAAAEALSLAGRLGLDQQRALELLGRGAAGSWMLSDRGPRMLTPPETVNSSVDIFVKDSQLAQETAERVAAPVPVLAAARELFRTAHRRGAGSADDSRVIDVLDSVP